MLIKNYIEANNKPYKEIKMFKTKKFCIYKIHGLNYLIIEKSDEIFTFKNKKNIFPAEIFPILKNFNIENVIYIQIAKTQHSAQVQILFFELDGSEFLFCGNGILCVSAYLFEKYKIRKVEYINSSKTTFFTLINKFGEILVNMGKPRLPPANYFPPLIKGKKQKNYIYINSIPITLYLHNKRYNLNLSAAYILSGEPHIIVFDFMLSHSEDRNFFNKIFLEAPLHNDSFFTKIGLKLNSKVWFPYGVNLNFARIFKKNIIEYRCFERGVNKEALVCCSGATAVAAIAYELGLVEGSFIQIVPRVACYQQKCKNMKLFLSHKRNGWWLKSTHNPQLVWING